MVASRTALTSSGSSRASLAVVQRISSGYRGAPNWSTRNSRIGTPSLASVTPSAFQNAVAASSLPAREVGDRVEADRHPVDARGIPAPGAEHGVQDGVVGGEPRDADRLALEVARRADLRSVPGDHRGQRSLDDRRDPDEVEPALAGDREVVDVEDRELRPAGLEQLGGVGRRRGLLNVQVDPRVAVVAARRARRRSRRGPRWAGSRAPGSRLSARPVQRRPRRRPPGRPTRGRPPAARPPGSSRRAG